MNKQANQPENPEKQNRLELLKQLLGVQNEEDKKDTILLFVLNKIENMILNYCNIEKVPKRLENVMLNMAVDLYRAESFGQEQAEGSVKSITEGDISVSFDSATSENLGFLNNYTTQLNRYRKLDW